MSGYSAIPPYRPFEWKLSEMKQNMFVNQNNDNKTLCIRLRRKIIVGSLT
jgi:hypothetical protein